MWSDFVEIWNLQWAFLFDYWPAFLVFFVCIIGLQLWMNRR